MTRAAAAVAVVSAIAVGLVTAPGVALAVTLAVAAACVVGRETTGAHMRGMARLRRARRP